MFWFGLIFSSQCTLNIHYLFENLELGDGNPNLNALTVGIQC